MNLPARAAQRRRDQLGRRPGGHGASAQPRATAGSGPSPGPSRLPVQPGAHRRLPVGARASRRRLRPGAGAVRGLPARGRVRARWRAARPAGPPTAIFAGSDQHALGVYEAARQRALRIPQDLSVVGFDDLRAARWLSPPLTTVRQPLAEMGRVAAQMLGELIEGRAAAQPAGRALDRADRRSARMPRGPLRRRQRMSPAAARRDPPPARRPFWRDPARPGPCSGSRHLLARMTSWRRSVAQLDQLVGELGHAGARQQRGARSQGEFTAAHRGAAVAELIGDGLGQLTRVFGTRPVPPAEAAAHARASCRPRSWRRAGSASRPSRTRSA